MTIGWLFLIGDIAINHMIPKPIQFTALNIIVNYIPMAWIGGTIAQKIQG